MGTLPARAGAEEETSWSVTKSEFLKKQTCPSSVRPAHGKSPAAEHTQLLQSLPGLQDLA